LSTVILGILKKKVNNRGLWAENAVFNVKYFYKKYILICANLWFQKKGRRPGSRRPIEERRFAIDSVKSAIK